MALGAGLACAALAVLEVFVIVQVAHHIGVLWTVGLLAVVPLIGVRVCAREGRTVIRRVRRQLGARRPPGGELADGLWVLVAAVLLVVPGFITDALALLLLLPWGRAVANRTVRAILVRRLRWGA